jgi:hypothetical protein
MKTPEEMAEEYCNTKQLSYVEQLVITKGFIDGYKAGQAATWEEWRRGKLFESDEDAKAAYKKVLEAK